MTQSELRTKEAQLRAATKDLHARTRGDFTQEEIRAALEQVVDYATPLGIKRMKWLKILTLWHLYPEAAPNATHLRSLLEDRSRHQDIRMREALELPVPEAAR